MNRRTAIRNAVVFSAGVVFIPSCLENDKASFQAKNLSLTGSEERTLQALCESILPAGNGFPGAGELKAHEFVLTMMDDCASTEDQARFSDGLKAFETACKTATGQTYTKSDPAQRKRFLISLENNKDPKDGIAFFYNSTKHFTVQAFTSSKKYMTDIRKYKMVPGPNFKGCVPVQNQI
jgi:hypothetical protein